jgi:phenylacetate-CoA ligase
VNWFNLSFKLNNYPLKSAKRKLQSIIDVPDRNYHNFIEERKSKILEHHFKTNAYYRKLCNDKLPEQWADVPVLTKSDFQVPLQERLSKDFTAKNTYINKTSGSSGHPFTFAKDKSCHALTWANIIKNFGAFGLDFNSSFQARFYGIPLNKLGYYKERVKDGLAKRYRFPIFNINEKTHESYIKAFKTKSFDYINGYTSVIVLFAKYLKQEGLILKEICPSLKVCIVTSEMLFEDDKLLLEQQLGVPIINEYGASELDIIAFQDLDKSWRINTETLFVEVLNEQNEVLGLGQAGKLVITSLYNEAHPFIRYEIGDIGALDLKSTPKHTILKTLVGRTNDLAKTPSGKVVPGLTFYYVTKTVIEDKGNVKEFVVKQTKLDTFKIEYVSKEELTETLKNKIREALTSYLEPGLQLELKRVKQLSRSKSGKLKQFESLL